MCDKKAFQCTQAGPAICATYERQFWMGLTEEQREWYRELDRLPGKKSGNPPLWQREGL